MNHVSTLSDRHAVWSLPLDQVNPAQPQLFKDDAQWSYFERLRAEDPVHYTADSEFGPYWSVTKYKDIMAVDTNHKVFSSLSTLGGISIRDQRADFPLPMFIAMDPPIHDAQRKVVSPIVAPGNLAILEHTIRERAIAILDSLPRGEAFDWVDRVSIELTTQMLATLFDFPWEDRHKLPIWSDWAAKIDIGPDPVLNAEREAHVFEMAAYFKKLFDERKALPPQPKSEPGIFDKLFGDPDRAAKAVIAANPKTVLYDIARRAVYMPDGERLEAHSGLGQYLDDPQSIERKDVGVTPPNVYAVSFREKPFHGVRALRMKPIGNGNMYGRDGILAHSYLLGEAGGSNGCISVRDYDKFLQAYEAGKFDRIIVVRSVDEPMPSQLASNQGDGT